MPSDVLTVTLAIVEGWNSYFSVTSSCKDNTIPVAAEGLSGLLATQNIDGSCYETQMSSAKRVSQLWTVQDPQTLSYERILEYFHDKELLHFNSLFKDLTALSRDNDKAFGFQRFSPLSSLWHASRRGDGEGAESSAS
ncbi:DNA-(apurinic or apyrimidinic site) lyase 2-like protein [Cricetulus griseus]|uniref:DNA-(Apurinic or apyrimidinic site) lyase 2-like protein n=1 Tax=Cricetulus griseus TaxID=10029 RepID=A0A061IMM6_CRIGR|nr:DNA-(apurinic or apyrimidinic site) lyase 2-like protein [Cricetulus griseus]